MSLKTTGAAIAILGPQTLTICWSIAPAPLVPTQAPVLPVRGPHLFSLALCLLIAPAQTPMLPVRGPHLPRPPLPTPTPVATNPGRRAIPNSLRHQKTRNRRSCATTRTPPTGIWRSHGRSVYSNVFLLLNSASHRPLSRYPKPRNLSSKQRTCSRQKKMRRSNLVCVFFHLVATILTRL